MASDDPFAGAVNPFEGAVNPFESDTDDFAGAVNPFEGAVNPFAEEPEPEPEHGFFANQFAGIAERGAQVAGGLADFAADTGRNLEERIPLGGFIKDPEAKFGFRYADGDEYKAKTSADSEWLEQAAQAGRDVDLGYEEAVPTSEIVDEWNDGDVFGVIGKSIGFGAEQLIHSLPDMVGAMANAPVYITARAGELAQERAKELGDEQPSSMTQAAGGAAAIVSGLMEKFGAEKVFGESKIGESLLTAVVRGAAAEGSTEAVQESIEYTGTKAGTGNFDLGEMGETAGWGALGGATGGGAMAGAQSVVDNIVGLPMDDGEVENAADRMLREQRLQMQGDLEAEAEAAAADARARGGDELDAETARMNVYLNGEEIMGGAEAAAAEPSVDQVQLPGVDEEQIMFNPYEQGMEPLQVGTPMAEDGFADDNMLEYADPGEINLDLSLHDLAAAEDKGLDYTAGNDINQLAGSLEQQIEDHSYTDMAAPDLAREEFVPPTDKELGEPGIPALEQAHNETRAMLEKSIKEADKAMPPKEKGNQKAANHEMELLQAIASEGGLSREDAQAQGIDPAEFETRSGGIARVFTNKGRSFDAMAERMSETGHLDGNYSANALLEKVSGSLSGEENYSSQSETAPERAARQAEIDAIHAELDKFEQHSYDDGDNPPKGKTLNSLDDAERELVYTMTEAELVGVDEYATDSILDAGMSIEDTNTALKEQIANVKRLKNILNPGQEEVAQSPEGAKTSPQSTGDPGQVTAEADSEVDLFGEAPDPQGPEHFDLESVDTPVEDEIDNTAEYLDKQSTIFEPQAAKETTGRKYVTSDGYTFHEQADGSLVDDPSDPDGGDMSFENIEALEAEMGDGVWQEGDEVSKARFKKDNPNPIEAMSEMRDTDEHKYQRALNEQAKAPVSQPSIFDAPKPSEHSDLTGKVQQWRGDLEALIPLFDGKDATVAASHVAKIKEMIEGMDGTINSGEGLFQLPSEKAIKNFIRAKTRLAENMRSDEDAQAQAREIDEKTAARDEKLKTDGDLAKPFKSLDDIPGIDTSEPAWSHIPDSVDFTPAIEKAEKLRQQFNDAGVHDSTQTHKINGTGLQSMGSITGAVAGLINDLASYVKKDGRSNAKNRDPRILKVSRELGVNVEGVFNTSEFVDTVHPGKKSSAYPAALEDYHDDRKAFGSLTPEQAAKKYGIDEAEAGLLLNYLNSEYERIGRRARPGGEIGVNGEEYKGGQLIANTDNSKVDRIGRTERENQTDIVNFGKYAGMSISEIRDADSGYVDWMANGGVFNDHPELRDALQEYIKSEKEIKAAQREEALARNVDTDIVLKAAGLRVNQLPDGRYTVKGNTYPFRGKMNEAGGSFDYDIKAYVFDEDPAAVIAALISDKDGTGVDLDLVSANAKEDKERAKELRKELDAEKSQKPGKKALVQKVSAATEELVKRGLKFGMPADVVREQIEDIGQIKWAFEEGKNAFVLASEAGSGKTYVMGGAIKEILQVDKKAKVLYVTMNTNLIDQLSTDLADYGIVDQVEFITYDALSSRKKNVQVDGDTVIMFDEAHNIKNVDTSAGSARAKKAQALMQEARMTVFASATPYENPVEMEYLAATGLFDQVGGFESFALAYGAGLQMVQARRGFNMVPFWPGGRQLKKHAAAAREWVDKQGVFTQRRKRLPEGMVDSSFQPVKVEAKYLEIYNKVTAAYESARETLGSAGGGNIAMHQMNVQKRILEAAKVQAAIKKAEEAIAKGEQAVIFVETKSDRKIGNDPSLDQMMQEMAEWRMTADPGDPPPHPRWKIVLAQAFDEAGIDYELNSTVDEIVEHFGREATGVYVGAKKFNSLSVTDKSAKKDLAEWKAGDKKVLVATMAKGGTGLSLHPTEEGMPRTQIGINLPWKATGVDQVTGRLARYGMQSHVNIDWLFAGEIPVEETIARRVGDRMSSMGATVSGLEMNAAEQLQDWDFDGEQDAGGTETVTTGAAKKPKAANPVTAGDTEVEIDPAKNLTPEQNKLRQMSKRLDVLDGLLGCLIS